MASKKSILNEFYVDGGDADVSHVLLHIAEPVSQEERRKGIFFAVVELRQVSGASIRAFQDVIQNIETAYYEDKTLENDVAWENALRVGNESAASLSTKGEIHACLATLCESTIHLTYHGEPVAWILYPTQSQLKLYNIFKGHEPSPDYFFSDIVEGELKLGHRVLIAAPSILKVLDQERFIKINREKTANSTAHYVQRFLEGLKNGFSFGGLLFEWRKEPQRPDTLTVQSFQTPRDSLTELANQEKETEQMLASSLTILARNWRLRFKQYLNALLKEKPAEPVAPEVPRHMLTSYKRLSTLTKESGKKMIESSRRAVQKLTQPDKRHDLFTTFGTASKSGAHSLWDWLTTIPLKTRLLLLGVVFLAVILFISITIIKVREGRLAERRAWEAEVTAVVQKKNQIEASLIYEDEEKARGLLAEVRGMIERLPADSRKERTEQAQLAAALETLAQDLQKRTAVEPTLVFEVPSEAQADHLALLNDTVVLTSSKQPTVFYARTFGVEITRHQAPGGIEGFRDITVDEEGKLFLISTGGRVVAAPANGALQELSTPEEARSRTIVDAAVYNNRLYTLDPFEKTILRFPPAEGGFGAPQAWLTQRDVLLGDAHDLAADGTLYVLKQNGELFQFNKGRKADFALSPLDPPFEQIFMFETRASNDGIFIADRGALKRIVHFDKKGKLVRQYTSDGWNDLRAFTVDPLEKRIYVLNGDRVESFGY